MRFIDLAASLDLLVILRPGPYICAEVDFGGLPSWLLELHPDIKIRSADLKYLSHVDNWFDVLLPMIKPRLYSNGGPIIMVQVENEYGSFGGSTGKCDLEYLSHLRSRLRSHLGPDVVLFTTDGNSLERMQCGNIPDVYSTVDFGTEDNIQKSFALQRLLEPRGPLVNSEFYPGWLDHWGEPHNKVSTNAVVQHLDVMLAMGANVNIYLPHGGTTFGFNNGANMNQERTVLVADHLL